MLRHLGKQWLERLQPRSIRFQITFKIWLVLIGVFALTNLGANLIAARLVLERGQAFLGQSSALLAFGLQQWIEDIRETLELEAGSAPFRSLNPELMQPELARLTAQYPDRYWRVWSASGRLLAHTGVIRDQSRAEREVFTSEHFQAARRGDLSYGAVHSTMTGQACLAYIVPIYRDGLAPRPGRLADGLLSFCLPVSQIKNDLDFAQLNRDLAAALQRTKDPSIQLSVASQYLVGNNGVVIHLLGPDPAKQIAPKAGRALPADQAFTDRIAFERMVSSMRQSNLKRWSWEGVELFAFSTPVVNNWRLVTLVDGADLFVVLRRALQLLLQMQVVALVLITLALYSSSGRLLAPLQFVAQALRRFRGGQFDLQLPPHRADEMGMLLEDLQITGHQLEDLLNQQKRMARQESQIETARRIQGDFLVRTLPQNPCFELAACSRPALDVGADWYDAMTLNDLTLLVVADVCDKGVGSALYMSVFRTLIRYGMQRALADGVVDQPLSKVLSLVNEYMIGNHGGSAMFATAFVALFDAATGRLDYVLAGQEPPLIKHQNSLLMLEECGPALGLFPASFVTRQHHLEPGDLLMAYSDGLVDARSEAEEPFGLERVKEVLLELDSTELGAQATLDALVGRARAHIGGAEPFDDLTVMTLLVR